MVNNDCRACLADFSLIRFAPDRPTFVSTCIEGGTLQWMSPELLDPTSFGLDGIHPTKESDCYALGMVIYEVLGGRVSSKKNPGFAALAGVLRGERPKRPQGPAGERFTDEIWDVVGRCWRQKPGDRATAEDVHLCLGGTPLPSRPPSPGMDHCSVDTGSDSDEGSDIAFSDS